MVAYSCGEESESQKFLAYHSEFKCQFRGERQNLAVARYPVRRMSKYFSTGTPMVLSLKQANYLFDVNEINWRFFFRYLREILSCVYNSTLTGADCQRYRPDYWAVYWYGNHHSIYVNVRQVVLQAHDSRQIPLTCKVWEPFSPGWTPGKRMGYWINILTSTSQKQQKEIILPL